MDLGTPLDDVFRANRGLVHHIARRWKDTASYKGLSYDDLVQIGAIALLKAAKAFDPQKGIAFSTYAHNAIVREVAKSVAGHNLLKIPRDLQRDIPEDAVPVSLDAELGDLEDEPLTLGDTVGEPDDLTAVHVREFLEWLGPKERAVAELLLRGFGINEASELLGVHRMTVGRRARAIREKLRRYIEEPTDRAS